MEFTTGHYGIGTQDGRDSYLGWEMFQHPDNCEVNINGENIRDISEGKAMPDSSCSLFNNSDLEFNIQDVFI